MQARTSHPPNLSFRLSTGLAKALIPAEAWNQERRSLCFAAGVNHWNIIADPATHCKKEWFFGVAYSWEQDVACFLDCQRMQPGNIVLLEETGRSIRKHTPREDVTHRCSRGRGG